jgi:hypothetical protein
MSGAASRQIIAPQSTVMSHVPPHKLGGLPVMWLSHECELFYIVLCGQAATQLRRVLWTKRGRMLAF